MKRTLFAPLLCLALAVQPVWAYDAPQAPDDGRYNSHAQYYHQVEVEPEVPVTTLRLTFAGDCMLSSEHYSNQGFAQMAATGDYGWFLGGVKYLFEDDDYTIVNLENVLTDRALSPVDKGYTPAYWYKAPTANTNILTSSSVEVVDLANNHTGDYGSAGAADTVKAVTGAGLLYGDNNQTVYLEKDGYRIALICHGLWSEGQADAIVNRIRDAEPWSDLQIVFYHGGKERVHAPEQWRIRASRKLVDAGADLVVGNHPHVLQPRETYNGVDIIYSMGNFVFGHGGRCENRTILYTWDLTIRQGEIQSESRRIIPCYVYGGTYNNFRPEVITDPGERQAVLDFMNWLTSSPV